MTKPAAEPIDLEAIRERCEKATEGPWEDKGGDAFGVLMDGQCLLATSRIIDLHLVNFRYAEDREFVVHARQDIPALLAEVDRLEKLEKLATELTRLLKYANSDELLERIRTTMEEREAEPSTIDEHLDEILHRWHESPPVVREVLRAALIAVARDQREADRRRCERVAAQLRDRELSEIALECARQISSSTMPDNSTKVAEPVTSRDLGLFAVFYDGETRPVAAFVLEQGAERYAKKYSGGTSTWEIKHVHVTDKGIIVPEPDVKVAEKIVEEWDTNNAICLLGDHRDDLIHNIEATLNSARADLARKFIDTASQMFRDVLPGDEHENRNRDINRTISQVIATLHAVARDAGIDLSDNAPNQVKVNQ